MEAAVPVIDLAPFLIDEGCVVGDAPTPSQLATAAAIDRACRDHGFLFLQQFGSESQNAAAFAAAQRLFSLPEAHKAGEMKRVSPRTNTGYSPLRSESLNKSRAAENKEAFNVRARANRFDGCPAGFEEAAAALWETAEFTARRYAMASALALGLPLDFFSRTLERMDLCTLRFLHYPPCDEHAEGVPPDEEGEDGRLPPLRVGEHTDFGLFTFLLLGEGAEGLQIKPVRGAEIGGAAGGEAGGWLELSVPPSARGGAVVNTGALLARWTNDVWRATAHRVIVPNAEVASRERYSIACFIDPDAEARIEVHPKFVAEGAAPRYTPTTGREYLLMKLREAQGPG
ncbi:hypothetical protein AB1Y20_002131 [Prymnesium parvum]|uniref:Fe2OG dioxygenase domain-containing protein n=1 Tax=Prymnesium parvum TaxID=97485 RepID=A0AB34J896_PRYPA